MRRILPLFAALCLAFAPAPFPKPPKPAPPTEVFVQVVGDRIDLTYGTRKESIKPDKGWRENLTARLKCFRERRPAPSRLIIRVDGEELAVRDLVLLCRIGKAAGYSELHLGQGGRSR